MCPASDLELVISTGSNVRCRLRRSSISLLDKSLSMVVSAGIWVSLSFFRNARTFYTSCIYFTHLRFVAAGYRTRSDMSLGISSL